MEQVDVGGQVKSKSAAYSKSILDVGKGTHDDQGR